MSWRSPLQFDASSKIPDFGNLLWVLELLMFEGVGFGKSVIKAVDFLSDRNYFTGAIKFPHLSQRNVF